MHICLLLLIKLFIGLFSLASCQSISYVSPEIAHIQIGPTSTIEEAECWGHLRQILPSQEPAKYYLTFRLEYEQKDLAISKTSDILRKRLTQKVFFELTQIDTNQVLLKSDFTLHSSYSLITHPMVSYGQQNTNKKFLSRAAAEKIRSRLVLFFKDCKKIEHNFRKKAVIYLAMKSMTKKI